MENSLNLPRVIALGPMKQVANFAEGELSYMALQGSKSGNPGLPLTDQQKTQIDNKKKAAAATAAAAAVDGKQGRAREMGERGLAETHRVPVNPMEP